MQERERFYPSCLIEFSMDLDGIQFAIETCLSDEPHIHLVLYNYYSKEKSLLC